MQSQRSVFSLGYHHASPIRRVHVRSQVVVRDFDLGRRRLRVHGKGGKIRHTPIPTEELREEMAEL